MLGGSIIEALSKKSYYCKQTFFAWLLAIVLLVGTGVVYRVTAVKLNAIAGRTVELDRPLAEFPIHVGDWVGENIALSETVMKVADNDDYLMRSYKNNETGQLVSLYIAYSAKPRTMTGHRPEICYPGSGWIHENSENTNVTLKSGQFLPCRVHRFHKPLGQAGNVVVLNFYILNGQLVMDEKEFAGLNFRMLNFSGDTRRYVTQVQISAGRVNSVVSAAAEFGDLILKYFPPN